MTHRIVLLALVATTCFTGTFANAQSGELVSAAKRGDLAAVNALLKSGADVNDRKFTGLGDATALMEASNSGHLEVVQALLAAKADVNATVAEKRDGQTALTLAVERGHVAVVRALVAAKADVNARCCNSLYRATAVGNVEMVKVLLTAKPDLNRPEYLGRTPLIQAISGGRLEIARLLMEARPNVNTWTEQGVTALMLAASENSPSSVALVQALLDARAEPDFRLCLSPGKGNVGFPNYARTIGGTALGLASSSGSADAVRALLAAKAEVNLAQCDGKTALMLALENDHQEVAELLRSAGAAAPPAK